MKLKLNLTALNLLMKIKVTLSCSFSIVIRKQEVQKLQLSGKEILKDKLRSTILKIMMVN